MDQENQALTFGPSAASNPGRLRVNYLRWLIHKPTWPLIWAGSALLCLVGALYLHWSLWIPATLLLAWNFLYYIHLREYFWHGCANPGLVISVDPLLIAAATDLTKGVGTYPAVKVFRARLRHIDGQLPRVGVRVGTVAVYTRTLDENIPHWRDFHPLPTQYATGDPKMISALMESFTADDWAQLERFLKQIPQPYRAGLYMINLESKPDEQRNKTTLGNANDGGWRMAADEDDGKAMIFRVRSVPPSFARKAVFRHLLAICWKYESPNDHGLPSPDVLKGMDELEDLLVPALEGSQQAFLTGVVTRDGMREWHWYARDNEAVIKTVNKTLGDHAFPVQVVWKDDPDWRFAQILLDLVS